MSDILRFLRLLNAPCEEISELISASLDETLPLSRRVAIRIHLAYCSACRKFRRHIQEMRAALRQMRAFLESDTEPGQPELSAEARARIKAGLTRS